MVGVWLGDAHVGRSGLDKAFISFEQSKSKIEYLNYLHKWISEGGFVLEEPKTYTPPALLAGIQDILTK